MKILKSWLKDYIKIDFDNFDIANKLSISGTEVESIASFLDSNVVVGEIKDIKKHPNADRLRIATVYDGENDRTVVCGAPNIEIGQIVPLAKVGAKLGDMEIKKSEIRGIESEGMLCAEDELDLGDDHAGIMILPNEYKVGEPLNKYIESDAVFELEITPNRGDCLSHIGIAREIGALLDVSVSRTPIALEMNGTNIKDKLSIEITDEQLCPQYMARIIEDIKIGPSPKWLQERLSKLGLKPINNIVDVTNYIMFDLGQPLHAFDAEKIEGKEIVIRKGKVNETITTLDGVERKVSDDILITDAKKTIAIAGVMGGQNSEITESTTTIILESAEFNRKNIRKTAKKLGLVTEASYRFERGIDSSSVEYALNKAAKLINEIAGGQILSGVAASGKRPLNKTLDIPHNKINNFVGVSLPESEINHLLKKLDFNIKNNTCIVPLWRHDIEIWQDLAEEVARMYGYGKIKPLAIVKEKAPKKSEYFYKEALKDELVSCGFIEVLNYPYLSERDIKSIGLNTKKLLEIANPIQPENKFLRNSLTPGLIKSVAKNPAIDPVLLFEIGKVFSKDNETSKLGIIASGKNSDKLIKKAIDKLSIRFKINQKDLQILALSQQEMLKFKVRKPVAQIIEVDLDMIIRKMKASDADLNIKISNKKITYRPISKFPVVARDLAFIVDKDLVFGKIEEAIQETSEFVNRVELFDEFASDKFGVNKKNLAYHIYLQHPEKTMTDKEAEEIIKKIITDIESKFNAKLRK